MTIAVDLGRKATNQQQQHDFTVVDLFTVTNVSSTIGGLSGLVIRSAHSGGIEGSISNIIVS